MAELFQPTSAQIRDVIGLPETLLKLGPIHSIIETASVLDLGPTADVMLSLDDVADKIFARKDLNVLGNVVQFTERALPGNPPANQGKLYIRDLATVTTLFFLDSAGTETNLLLGGGGAQTPWTSDIDADGFDLNDLSNILFRNSAGVPLATDRSIHYNDLEGMVFNTLTDDVFRFEINGILEYSYSATAADFGSNNVTNMGTLNTHTIPAGTSTFALFSDNLSVFAATTSLQLIGVISDETGTGLLVFNDTPTILTPTIASFVNATHSHLNATGGGTITRTAISDFNHDLLSTEHSDTLASAVSQGSIIIGNVTPAWNELVIGAADNLLISNATTLAYAKIANANLTSGVFGAITGVGVQTQDFDLSTNFMDIGEIATPLDPSVNVGRLYVKDLATVTTLFFRDSAGTETNVLTGTPGEFFGPWTADHDAGGFDLLNVGGIQINNPADTFQYIITPVAIIADRIVNLPLLTATDTITMDAFGTTLTNKIMTAGANTFSGFAIGTEVTGASTDLTDTGVIVRTDQANIMGDFDFTLKDNRLRLENPAGTFEVGFQTSAEIADRVLTIPLLGANRTIIVTDLASQIVIGTEVTGASTALTDTADIAYLNQANTFGAFLQDFAAASMRIPVSAAPTIAVNGDIGIDTTIADFTTPLIRYFGTESMVVVSVPDAQIITPTGGHVITYNATNDEFELVAATGGEFTGAWTADHNTGGSIFSLQDARFADPTDNTKTIQLNLAGMTTAIELTISTSQSTARTLTIPNIGANRSFVVTGETSQIVIGTEVTGASTALTDTADIAYLNTANTFIAGNKNTFAHSATTAGIAVLPVAGNPSGQADGDLWLNLTTQQLFARINGADVDLGAAAGGGQTPWLQDIDADGFDLTDLSNIIFRTSTGVPAATDRAIHYDDTEGMVFNALTGDVFRWEVNGVLEMSLSFSTLNLQGNQISMAGGIPIQWGGTSLRQILNDAGGFTFDVQTGDTFEYQINDVVEMVLAASSLKTGDVVTPQWDLERTTAQVNGYVIGELRFRHPDGGAVQENYAMIRGVMEKDTAASEDGSLKFFVTENGVHDVLFLSLNDNNNSLISMLKPVRLLDSDSIQWVNTLRAISNSASGFIFDVQTSDTFSFDINGTPEVTIDATGILMATGNDLRLGQDDEINWGGSVQTRILGTATGLEIRADTGDNIRFNIFGTDEVTIDASALTMIAGNNIIIQASGALGLITMGELTTPATPATNTGSFYVKDIAAVSTAFFIGDDGVEINLTTGAEVFTWTADHDAADFDLLQIDNITSGADNLHTWDLERTATLANNTNIGAIRFRANDGAGVPVVQDYGRIESELKVDTDGAEQGELKFFVMSGGNPDFLFLSINEGGASTVSIKRPVRLNAGSSVEWGGTASKIFNDASGFVFDIPTGDDFSFDVNGVTELTIDTNGLIVGQGNNILMSASGGFGFIQMGELTTPATPTANLGKYYVKDVGTISTAFFIGDDGVEINLTTGAEVTTWTADHDTGGFSLLLTDDASPPAGSVTAIYAEAGELNANVAAGNLHNWRINDVLEMTLSATVLNLQGNNLTSFINLNSNTTDVTFNSSASGWQYDVATGDTHDFRINNVSEMILNATTLDLQNNGLQIGTGTLSMGTSTIAFAAPQVSFDVATGERWTFRVQGTIVLQVNAAEVTTNNVNLKVGTAQLRFNNSTETISIQSGDMIFDVPTTDVFSWDIAGVPEMTLSATELNLQGNNLILQASGADGYLQVGALTTPSTPADGLGKYYTKELATITTPFFIGDDGVEINLATGSETLVWTANHDANGFALEDARIADDTDNTKIIDFNLSGMTTGIVLTLLTAQTTAQTITIPNTTGADDFVLEDFVQTLTGKTITMAGILTMGTNVLQFVDANQTITNNSGNLFYDVATGQVHLWRINNVTEMQLSATALAMQGNAILQVAFLTSNVADPALAGLLRLAVTDDLAWRNNANNADILLNIDANDKLNFDGHIADPVGTHDDYYDAGNLVEVTSATPDTVVIGTTGNRKGVLKMDFGAADEFATIKLTPPRNWDASTITVVLKFTTGVEGAGTIIWGVSGVAVADLDDLSAAATNYGGEITVTDTQTNINEEQFSPRTAAITLANTPVAGDSVYLKIRRDGAVDTFPNIAFLLGIFVEWGIDEATAT